MPLISFENLTHLAEQCIRAMGTPPREATIVADHLARAHLAGHDSHGLIRLPQYQLQATQGKLKVNAPVEVERESSTTALLNANYTWGPVAAAKATEMAIAKAKTHGMAAVGVRQCHHVGRVGVYPLMAAEHRLIGKVWCNGHGVARVAPWGGTEARLATNPIAIALPTGNSPVLVDITTSVVAEGKVRLAKNKGVPIPQGWVLNKAGQPTTNPADLYDGGTLLPFGGDVGHKGYGLSLIVDMLGGALTGAGCGVMPGVGIGNGLLVEVLDPTLFQTWDDYQCNMDRYIAYVKSSQRKEGVDEILLPGEPEMRLEAKRRAEGIFIDDETWRQVAQTARELSVDWPTS